MRRRDAETIRDLVAMEWKPFADAPLDGTVVDLCAVDSDGGTWRITNCAFTEEPGGRIGMWRRVMSGEPVDVLNLNVTHFMKVVMPEEAS